jgi:hypothetical protein
LVHADAFLALYFIRRRRTKHEEFDIVPEMDEGRKRVIGIMAAILASLHMQTADDLFGGPQGSPRTDKLISASVQWAEEIMRKIDAVCNR